MRKFLWSLSLLLLALSTSCHQLVVARAVRFYSDLKITSWDGTVLMAQAAVPENLEPNSAATIIMPNSWLMPVIEYIVQLFKLAGIDNFIVVEYETRGWWTESGGCIDAAGPADQKDIGSVIDFVVSQNATWGVRTDAIGMAGISYGAGLSLLGAALDPRVKAAASMSGWGSLSDSLFPDRSLCSSTVELLVGLAELFGIGKPCPVLVDLEQQFLEARNISGILDFGRKRSADQYIDVRTKPIYMVNNFNDEFFGPGTQVNFFNTLNATHSRMRLNQGAHAESELWGLFDLGIVDPSHVWTQVARFFQATLQKIDNNFWSTPLFEVQTNDIFSSEFIAFSSFPVDANAISPVTFGFAARGSNRFGALTGGFSSSSSSSAASSALHSPPRLMRHLNKQVNGEPAQAPFVDSIGFSTSSGLYPPGLIEDFLEPTGFVPLLTDLALTNPASSIVYMTPSGGLPHDALICGEPLINITVQPSSSKWQLYSYLYFVDHGLLDNNVGQQMTWGVLSSYDQPEAISSPKIVQWRMRAMCERIPAGKSIALGFSLYNELYVPASQSPLAVSFDYAGATLSLPYNPS